jgi:hypothetical protein
MNPPLHIRDVEVVSVTPETNTIRMVVHVKGKKPEDLPTFEMKAFLAERTQSACNYLRDEGFLEGSRILQWNLAVNVVLQ